MWGIILKLFTPVLGGVLGNVARIFLVVSLAGLGGFTWLTVHDSKIRLETIKQCPPQNIYTGNPVVNQQQKKMRCFPLAISRWGFGFCHE